MIDIHVFTENARTNIFKWMTNNIPYFESERLFYYVLKLRIAYFETNGIFSYVFNGSYNQNYKFMKK